MRSVVSLVLIVLLCAGAVPPEAFAAWAGAESHQCAHGHGDDCRCPGNCSKPAPEPGGKAQPEGPACHRSAAPKPDAETSGTKACWRSCSRQADLASITVPPESLEPPSHAALQAVGSACAALLADALGLPERSPQPASPPPRSC